MQLDLIMARYIFRIAYVGDQFTGFQKQLNGQAVENYIENAFVEAKYIKSFISHRYRGMSRTDIGVNALSNIFAIDLDEVPNLLRINYFLPISIVIWNYACVSVDFNPRIVRKKQYLYRIYNILDKFDEKLARIFQFQGKHNFENFIKKDGAGKEDPISTISKIQLQRQKKFIDIIFTGNRFGRQQIRRMVGILLDENYLDKSVEELLVAPKGINHINPASGEFLSLYDVEFLEKIDWILDYKSINDLLEPIRSDIRDKYNAFAFLDDMISKDEY